MKILCTICARAGSKGVANKNLRLINNKPLIVYSIEQAISTKLFDQIVVSSDSKEIREIALANGATFCVDRPAELATDTAPKLPAIKHCVENAEKKFVTSRLPTVQHFALIDLQSWLQILLQNFQRLSTVLKTPRRNSGNLK